MNNTTITRVLATIETAVIALDDPLATEDTTDGDPYRILISCLLSQRTKEETTLQASRRLFAAAATPLDMVALSSEQIETLIYPVGFWKTKARHILSLSSILLSRHGGMVPADMGALLQLPGVGRKTANLVLADAFGIPAICVDIHVHRIMNRLGFVHTATPEDTETSLRHRLPRELWMNVNYLLVLFGRNICTPQSPRCSLCPVRADCAQRLVIRSR
ncbi:MAG: endonuclease III [Candidatus Eisenbacteria bacterium]|jgi:endonuclease-3|nr:endonuclease III [Candidatus Eisenbacteria bacterium]